jgi:hypothetical protein
MVNFSDLERNELRHYFEAIAEIEGPNKQRRIRLDRLEDMLISLGLTDRRKEVEDIVRAIDDSGKGELDFEQYLALVRAREDPAILRVFQAMIDGKLGDCNLNFRTVISGYRRGVIIDATGARAVGEPDADKQRKQELDDAKKRGIRILNNFATMQKSRWSDERVRQQMASEVLPFDSAGYVPPGGLEMLWHTVCRENNLTPSRPPSADRREGKTRKSKRTLDPPLSPQEIIQKIVPGHPKRHQRFTQRAHIIRAPSVGSASNKSVSSSQEKLLGSGSRPNSKEGNLEMQTSLDDACGDESR